MTRQGLGLLLVGLLGTGIGLAAQWPELLIIGLLVLGAVLLALVFGSATSRGEIVLHNTSIEVPRFEAAVVDVEIRTRRRRGLHLEVESDPTPRSHYGLRRVQRTATAALTLPTDRRQVEHHGPVVAVWSDPFGIVRRVLARGDSVELVVTPRRGSIDDDLRTWNPGDDWEAPRSLRRTHLSELLTEYVVGDEPRRIHWRSSARTGKLMVRQRVGTESRDTLVYLDSDPQAWRASARFEDSDSVEQFELGVELATSVVQTLVAAGAQVAFLGESDQFPYFVDRVSAPRFGRKMAEVDLQPAAAISHDSLARALRAHRFRRIIVVTFRPSPSLERVLAERGRSSVIRLVTPMPPQALGNERFPVESVQWIPSAG